MDTDKAQAAKSFDEALAAKEKALEVEADKRVRDGKADASASAGDTATPQDHLNPDG